MEGPIRLLDIKASARSVVNWRMIVSPLSVAGFHALPLESLMQLTCQSEGPWRARAWPGVTNWSEAVPAPGSTRAWAVSGQHARPRLVHFGVPRPARHWANPFDATAQSMPSRRGSFVHDGHVDERERRPRYPYGSRRARPETAGQWRAAEITRRTAIEALAPPMPSGLRFILPQRKRSAACRP